jgi:hypothetical protein
VYSDKKNKINRHQRLLIVYETMPFSSSSMMTNKTVEKFENQKKMKVTSSDRLESSKNQK